MPQACNIQDNWLRSNCGWTTVTWVQQMKDTFVSLMRRFQANVTNSSA